MTDYVLCDTELFFLSSTHVMDSKLASNNEGDGS